MKDFKVRCLVSRSSSLKVGKVYEVKDGVLYADNGYKFNAWSDNRKGDKTPEALFQWFYSKFELVSDKPQFTKDMLKTGMRVERRDGSKLIVLLGTDQGDIIANSTEWERLEYLTEDLKVNYDGFCKWDIMKVYDSPATILITNIDFNTAILWQRPEIPKMTHKEIEDKLGFEFEYVKE